MDVASPGFGFEPVTVAGSTLLAVADGPGRLAALLDLIAGARERLQLFYYIFSDDTSGYAVRDSLADAARRGVRVSLIVDGFGSSATPDEFFMPLRAAGGHVARFRAALGRRYLLRNHQKMAIADGRLALIGGFNIEDGYFTETGLGRWRDFGLRVEGPAVEWLAGYHDTLAEWIGGRHPRLRRFNRAARSLGQPGGGLTWFAGRPTLRLSDWARAIKRDLRHGRSLAMIQAYFAPGGEILQLLKRLAGRGEVRIVTAGRTDNGATIGAARALYAGLHSRGARIFEYRPAMLHTKLIVIDTIAYAGSANFDMRSFYLNMEVMLRIDSHAMAAQLTGFIDHEIAQSDEITPEAHRSRSSLFNRLRWRLAYFLVATADYTVSRRLNLGLGRD